MPKAWFHHVISLGLASSTTSPLLYALLVPFNGNFALRPFETVDTDGNIMLAHRHTATQCMIDSIKTSTQQIAHNFWFRLPFDFEHFFKTNNDNDNGCVSECAQWWLPVIDWHAKGASFATGKKIKLAQFLIRCAYHIPPVSRNVFAHKG